MAVDGQYRRLVSSAQCDWAISVTAVQHRWLLGCKYRLRQRRFTNSGTFINV